MMKLRFSGFKPMVWGIVHLSFLCVVTAGFAQPPSLIEGGSDRLLSGIGDEDPELKRRIAEAMASGEEAFDGERYGEAIAHFGRVIRLDEAQAVAHLRRAQAYVELEELQKAFDSFDRALVEEELFEDDVLAEAFNGRGELYLEAQHAGPARSDFDRAVEINYANNEYLLNLGIATTQLPNPQAAIKIIDKVIERDDQNAKAYHARGQAHGMLSRQVPGEMELALADFDKAIQLDPNDKTFYHNLGIVLLQNDLLIPAVQTFTQAIQKDVELAAQEEKQPDYVEPVVARGLVLIRIANELSPGDERQETYQLAIVDADRALAMNPTLSVGLLIRGTAYRMIEKYGDAIDAFTEILKFNPESTEALYRRGIAWYYLGDDGLALADFEQASLFTPEDVRPYMWQGFTHAQRKDYYEAVNAYGRAIEQDERFEPAFINRGLAYLQLGQFDKAISDFDESIRIDPTNDESYFKRGIAYEMKEERELAAASYQGALKIDPQHEAARRKLADLGIEIDALVGLTRTRGQVIQDTTSASPGASEPFGAGAGPPLPGSDLFGPVDESGAMPSLPADLFPESPDSSPDGGLQDLDSLFDTPSDSP